MSHAIGCGCRPDGSFNPDLLDDDQAQIWAELRYCPVHWSHVPVRERALRRSHAALVAALEQLAGAPDAWFNPKLLGWVTKARAALALAKGGVR